MPSVRARSIGPVICTSRVPRDGAPAQCGQANIRFAKDVLLAKKATVTIEITMRRMVAYNKPVVRDQIYLDPCSSQEFFCFLSQAHEHYRLASSSQSTAYPLHDGFPQHSMVFLMIFIFIRIRQCSVQHQDALCLPTIEHIPGNRKPQVAVANIPSHFPYTCTSGRILIATSKKARELLTNTDHAVRAAIIPKPVASTTLFERASSRPSNIAIRILAYQYDLDRTRWQTVEGSKHVRTRWCAIWQILPTSRENRLLLFVNFARAADGIVGRLYILHEWMPFLAKIVPPPVHRSAQCALETHGHFISPCVRQSPGRAGRCRIWR